MAALREVIQWLSSISSLVTVIIICDCKYLFQAVSNTSSADLSVIQMQAAAAVLAMLKSILIVWAPGHCGLSGNEFADHQAKLVPQILSPTTHSKQLHGALTSAVPVAPLLSNTERSHPPFLSPPSYPTRSAHIRRSCRPPPIQHGALTSAVPAAPLLSDTERFHPQFLSPPSYPTRSAHIRCSCRPPPIRRERHVSA